MNCRQVTRLLSAYVDGELTGVEMLDIRRHIGDCADCREEFEATRAMKVMVSRLRTVHPQADFLANLSAKLDEIEIPAYQRVWNSFTHSVRERFSPVTTAFVAVSLALIILSARSIDPVGTVEPVTIAHTDIPEIHHINVLGPEIMEMKDPFLSSPLPQPVTSGSGPGSFVMVGFNGGY